MGCNIKSQSYVEALFLYKQSRLSAEIKLCPHIVQDNGPNGSKRASKPVLNPADRSNAASLDIHGLAVRAKSQHCFVLKELAVQEFTEQLICNQHH